MIRLFVSAVIVSLLSVASLQAKPLYVNGATGNDATTYAANTSSTPWRTIGRAAYGSTSKASPNALEAAKPGDVVTIAAGTYTTVGNLTGGGGGRWDVAYNPANHGTATAPIRFVCDPKPCVLTYSSGAGPMIGASSRNYIEWSGFTVSELTAPTRSDTGPVTFNLVTGGAIEDSILTGNPNWTGRVGDNYPGVRLEDAVGVRVVGNTIKDYGGQTGDRNHAGIETYRSYPVTIENNLIENCASGIYMKAVHTTTLVVDHVSIKFNRFVNNRWGVNVLRMPMTEQRPMIIAQNIFERNRESGMWVTAFDNGVTDPTWIRVINNTFVNDVAGLFNYNFQVWKPNSQHLYANNIVVGGSMSVRMDTADIVTNSTRDRQAYDNNVYFGAAVFASMGGQNRTIEFWRGLGQDLTSLTVDPQFVDAGGGDYRLSASSPARTAGRAVHGVGGSTGAIIPAGAYIVGDEVIGPSGGVIVPPAPQCSDSIDNDGDTRVDLADAGCSSPSDNDESDDPPIPTPCTFSITPTSASFSPAGSTGNVQVGASASTCVWTAVSNVAWAAVGAAGGTGSATLPYSVGVNTGTARTGTFTIAGLTFTITQSEVPPPPPGCVDLGVTYPRGAIRRIQLTPAAFDARVTTLAATGWRLEYAGATTAYTFVIASCPAN